MKVSCNGFLLWTKKAMKAKRSSKQKTGSRTARRNASVQLLLHKSSTGIRLNSLEKKRNKREKCPYVHDAAFTVLSKPTTSYQLAQQKMHWNPPWGAMGLDLSKHDNVTIPTRYHSMIQWSFEYRGLPVSGLQNLQLSTQVSTSRHLLSTAQAQLHSFWLVTAQS